MPPAVVRAGLEMLPAAIAAVGACTSERFIEFLTLHGQHSQPEHPDGLRLGVGQFFDWCQDRHFRVEAIQA